MEKWKIIPFEDEYSISSEGNVRNNKTLIIKSQRYDRYGYKRVTLYPSGKTYTIHRLVMLTFKPDEINENINHIDGKRDNNKLQNLEWCTISYNSKHRDTILRRKWVGDENPRSTLTKDEAYQIKYKHPELTNKILAEKYNTSAENIRRIRKGERWKDL